MINLLKLIQEFFQIFIQSRKILGVQMNTPNFWIKYKIYFKRK